MNPDHPAYKWAEDTSFLYVALWIGAAIALVFAAFKAWPTIKNGVLLIDLLVNLGKKLEAMDTKLEAVRDQVENSHDTNMREEQDERHGAVIAEIRGVKKDVGRLDQRDIDAGKDITRLEVKLDKHLEWAARQEARIDSIEDTIDPKEKK